MAQFERDIFRISIEKLLELYNALNDSDYTDADQLEIATLESAIYMSMKNDVAFVVDHRLYLYEH